MADPQSDLPENFVIGTPEKSALGQSVVAPDLRPMDETSPGHASTMSYASDIPEDQAMGEVGVVAKGWRHGVDISEVYSPPRVATATCRRGLKAGTRFDLTVGWDLLDPEVQQKCRERILEEQPELLIGSVMCRDWSAIMNINWPRMKEEEIQKRMKEARIHLEFVCSLYRLQHDAGRHFLHAHPQAAGSWREEVVIELLKLTGADALTI